MHPQRFRELENENTTDELTQALRFVYRTWYSFGAKGAHFAAAALSETVKGQVRRPLDTVRDLLEATSERLRRVRLEQRDFAELIQRFDTADTFFYLDPPYVHYQANARYDALAPVRREELFDALSNIKGSFLMSFDDCIEVRDLATKHAMSVEEVKTRYSLNGKEQRREVTELLVSWHARGVLPSLSAAADDEVIYSGDPRFEAIAALVGI